MCKAPKPPKPKEPKKPMFLRNRYLDEFIGDSAAVKTLKTGRNSLRIPMGAPTPVAGRNPPDTSIPQGTPPPTMGPLGRRRQLNVTGGERTNLR